MPAVFLPLLLSVLMLAAHFLRAGSLVLAVAVIVAPLGLALWRRPWSIRLAQLLMVLGALEWMRTLAVFAQERADAGEPWTRLAIILSAVAAWTLVSGLLLELLMPGRQRRSLR